MSGDNTKELKDNCQRVSPDDDEAFQRQVTIARAFFNRGLTSGPAKGADDVIGDFDKAIRVSLKYADGYWYRGMLKAWAGDDSGAITDFNHAIRLNPRLAQAYFSRGLTKRSRSCRYSAIAYEKGSEHYRREKSSDLDHAIADLDHAIEIDPEFGAAYLHRGVIKKAAHDDDDAIADFDQAIGSDPKFALAYFTRGVTRRSMGDVDGAIADFDQAVRLDPHDFEARLQRADAKVQANSCDDVIADIDAALEANPQNAEAYFSEAKCPYLSVGFILERVEGRVRAVNNSIECFYVPPRVYSSDPTPAGVDIPDSQPRGAKSVCSTEVGFTADSDTYCLSTNRNKTLWILWTCGYDDSLPGNYSAAHAYCGKKGVEPHDAAAALLRFLWSSGIGSGAEGLEGGTLLSYEEVTAIAKAIGPD